MKLNINLIFDELKNYHPQFLGKAVEEAVLQGVRYLAQNTEPVSEKYIYVLKSSNLGILDKNCQNLSLILLGQENLSDSFPHSCCAIKISDCYDVKKIFEDVMLIFEKYSEWSEKFKESILKKRSIQSILERGGEFLFNPIAFFDVSFQLVSKCGELIPEKIEGSVWQAVLEKGYSPIDTLSEKERLFYFQNLEECTSAFYMKPAEKYTDSVWLTAPIRRGKQLYGFLATCDINQEFTKGQYFLISYIQKILELYWDINMGSFVFSDAIPYYVERLLSGYSIETSMIEYHLKKYGWRIDDDYLVIYIIHSEKKRIENQFPFLVGKICQIIKSICVFPYDEGIIAITKVKNDFSKEEMFQNFERFLCDMNLKAGISMKLVSFLDIKYGYMQSRAAIAENRTEAVNKYICYIEDCYSKYIIHLLKENISLKGLCHPKLYQMLENDSPSTEVLFKTLKIFLENGENISRAAEILHIHRNTLMYRIEKIEGIVEMSMKDLNDNQFFALYLSCLIGLDSMDTFKN